MGVLVAQATLTRIAVRCTCSTRLSNSKRESLIDFIKRPRVIGLGLASVVKHTLVERFARSRVGIWHAALLRVIPPVRVKSLGFACVCVK